MAHRFNIVPLVTGVLALSVFLCAAIYAWSEPGDTPPNGTINAPINTGDVAQTKSGNLTINGAGGGIITANGMYFYGSGYHTDGLPYSRLTESWGTRFASPDTKWALSTSGSFYVGYGPDGIDRGAGNLYASGNVGVGTLAPDSKLQVVGDIKGTRLCIGDICRSGWGGSSDQKCSTGQSMVGIKETGEIICSNDAVNFAAQGYSYAKMITVSYGGSPLSDYAVNFTIDTQALISAGKMRGDCGDIRLSDSDTTTMLNYWIESGCNTASTKIWVNVPVVETGTKKLVMYYGNPAVSSTSNSSYTFINYWDFNSSSEGWTYGGNNGTTIDGIRCGWYDNANGWFGMNTCASLYGHNYVYKDVTLPSGGNISVFFKTAGRLGGNMRLRAGTTVLYDECLGGGGIFYDRGPYNLSSWVGQTVRLMFEETGGACGGGVCNEPNSENRYVDNVLIRRYVNPEPTCGVGSEVEL